MTMANVVTALVPAFAAGLAVQRLLEVLDPLINKRGWGNKKTTFGVLSLIVGGMLAWLSGIRNLTSLAGYGDGPAVPATIAYLDFLVTALVISAVTEGLNSMLKFLAYKKEEKKAEAVREKVEAVGSRAAAERWSGAPRDLIVAGELLGADFATARGPMTVEEALESALKAELRKRWESKFTETDWKRRPFSEYHPNVDFHKEAVREATVSVAKDLQMALTKRGKNNLQREIELTTTPEGALPLMKSAIG